MKKTKYLYDLRVRPGIFHDGTYGVYAIPQDNNALEYQLISQLDSEEEAIELANRFLTNYKETFSDNDIEVVSDRESKLDFLTANREKEKQESALREHLKRQFKAPETLKFRPLDRITNSTPHLLSYLVLVVFLFSISISVPKWVPILGDWMGNKAITLNEFANYYPFVILFCALYVQFRARKIGLQLAAARDYVLVLALKHGWRREQFSELFMDVVATSAYGWALKLGEWMSKWDPNSFSKGIQEIPNNHSDASVEEAENQTQDLAKFLLLEDFEARIHGLYYMDKEKNYRSWAVILYPIFFLINISRARRKLGDMKRLGIDGFLFDAVWALPGEGEYKVRKLFYLIAGYEILLIAGPIIWAFVINPWNGIFGWVGMCILILLSVLPMLSWNYQLLVQHRGLPRSMALEEIQGDQRFIRGM